MVGKTTVLACSTSPVESTVAISTSLVRSKRGATWSRQMVINSFSLISHPSAIIVPQLKRHEINMLKIYEDFVCSILRQNKSLHRISFLCKIDTI
jgi:hypothetical protein